MVKLWHKSWGKNYPDMLTYHLSVTFEMISSGVSSVAQSFPRFSPCPFNSTSSVWASFPWDAILSAVDCASLFSSELRVNSGELCILRYLLCSFKPTWRKSVTAKVEAFSLCLKKKNGFHFSLSLFPLLFNYRYACRLNWVTQVAKLLAQKILRKRPGFERWLGSWCRTLTRHSTSSLAFPPWRYHVLDAACSLRLRNTTLHATETKLRSKGVGQWPSCVRLKLWLSWLESKFSLSVNDIA